MWNARSRMAGFAGQRARVLGRERRAAIETLEGRCLLSGSAVDAQGPVETITRAPVSAMTLTEEDSGYSRDEIDATGTYTGELKLRRMFAENGQQTSVLSLEIDSQDEFGNISGRFEGERFGVANFIHGVFNNTKRGDRGWVRNLDARYLKGEGDDGLFTAGKEGVFDGHFNPRNNDQIQGQLRDNRGRLLGRITLDRTSVGNPPDEENNAPVAVDDTVTTDAGEPLRMTQARLLGNDTDADADDRLTITAVTAGTGGTVTLNSDGTITFTPDAGVTTANFTYTVSDGDDTDEGLVTVDVTAVEADEPVAGADVELTTTEDTALVVSDETLLAGASDPDDTSSPANDTLTITGVSNVTNGTAEYSDNDTPDVGTDDTITFRPQAGFTGIASFDFTVSDPEGNTDIGHAFVTVTEDDGNGGGDDDGTEPTGTFPEAGTANFAVQEVNAETNVTIANIADALDILDDFNTAQAGDAADDDDADAIARYGVAQIDYGLAGGTAGTAQFQTLDFGADNIALEAIGDVGGVGATAVDFTLGIRSTGAARLFVNGTQVLDLAGDDADENVQATVPLKDGDQLRLIYAETNTPDDTEVLVLYALGPDGDDEGTELDEVPLGLAGSGVTIAAPEVPPSGGSGGDGGGGDGGGNGGGGDGDGDGGGNGGGNGAPGGGNGGGDGDGGGSGEPSAPQVAREQSLVGTYEGTLRLTARSTDAVSTGRNRAITISIASHTTDGALRGTVEVNGLVFDANGDGVVNEEDDRDRDGNGDLNFTGRVSGDRFALSLDSTGALGDGAISGTVRPGNRLEGSLLFGAGDVFADGDFNADRTSTQPGDPNPPLVDPDEPVPAPGGGPENPNTPGNGGGGVTPDAPPDSGNGGDADTGGGGDGEGDEAGNGSGGGGSGDPLVGPGSADEGPGSAGSGPGSAGGDGIGENAPPSDGIGGSGSDPGDDQVGGGSGGFVSNSPFSNSRIGGGVGLLDDVE